jgi:hypothetical protein
MSKFFLDTEFHEGFHKPLFGKKRHFIDLISIGIVNENGREYYAISKDFDIKAAWNAYDLNHGSGDQRNMPPRRVYWLRENVLKPIFEEWKSSTNGKIVRLGLPIALNEEKFNYKNFKRMVTYVGKSNKQIANELITFCHYGVPEIITQEFYGYYADYDWVLICSLFGKMIDLPRGFPMYCTDLKQMLEETAQKFTSMELSKMQYPVVTHNVLEFLGNKPDFDKSYYLKNHKCYPKQENLHNALSDAIFNKKLYNFLKSL